MKSSTKKGIKISAVVVACITAAILAAPAVYVGGAFALINVVAIISGLGAPTPAEPVIKEADIHYELRYEIDGEERVYSNTTHYKYAGIILNEGNLRRYRNWTSKEEHSTLVGKGESYTIHCRTIGNAGHFMGDPDEYDEYGNNPYINVTKDGEILDYYGRQDFYNEHNFKIISWHCDPPIENTFK